MGKWTPDYVDDVLQHKFSSLVTGAIRRAAVEKDITPITYECFVNELDTGDSFTTTLIDILVKEVADRCSRPNTSEKRLLSDRTLKSLRTLATARPYMGSRPARYIPRRHILSDHPGAPHMDVDLIDDDDEDEYNALLDNPIPSVLEGTRMPEYDTVNPWPHNPPPPPSITAPRMIPASPVSDEWPVIRPWTATAPASAPTTLNRQSSIRRAARSRVVDFNDFSYRRRATDRDARSESTTGAESREESAPTGAASTARGPTAANSVWTSGGAVRRFFPFPPRTGPSARRTGSPANPHSLFEYSPESPSQPFSAQYYEIVGSAQPIRSSSSDSTVVSGSTTAGATSETPDDILTRAPRLRRGGVRPPETLPRSPVYIFTASPPPQTASANADVAPVVTSEPGSATEPPRMMSRVRRSSASEPTSSAAAPVSAPEAAAPSGGGRSALEELEPQPAISAIEELVSYPTPGSTENENP